MKKWYSVEECYPTDDRVVGIHIERCGIRGPLFHEFKRKLGRWTKTWGWWVDEESGECIADINEKEEGMLVTKWIDIND
jgi:hypothetical protein